MSSEKKYINPDFQSFFENSLSSSDPEIYKAIKDSEAFHKANIDMFNAAHAQKMKNINALINFMPKAKQLFEKRQEYADDRDELNRLVGIGDNLETDALEAQADTYNDELGVALSGEQGQLEVDGAPYELVNIAAAESITTPQQNIRNAIDKETQLFPSKLAESNQLNVVICSLEIKGSPKSSFFKQYSINGSFNTVPSTIPSLLVRDPVAIFLTINSIGKISTNFINCSLIFNLLTK